MAARLSPSLIMGHDIPFAQTPICFIMIFGLITCFFKWQIYNFLFKKSSPKNDKMIQFINYDQERMWQFSGTFSSIVNICCSIKPTNASNLSNIRSGIVKNFHFISSYLTNESKNISSNLSFHYDVTKAYSHTHADRTRSYSRGRSRSYSILLYICCSIFYPYDNIYFPFSRNHQSFWKHWL